MKLFGSTTSKITKDENGENVPHLEITEVVLVHCSIVNNDYQQGSRVFYTFVTNKLFGQLLDISPKSFIFLKTDNPEFSSLLNCAPCAPSRLHALPIINTRLTCLRTYASLPSSIDALRTFLLSCFQIPLCLSTPAKKGKYH